VVVAGGPPLAATRDHDVTTMAGGTDVATAVVGGHEVADELLATLHAEHPVLAGGPARERLMAATWLAGYRSTRTRRAYAGDLAAWLAWLEARQVDVLAARRVHVDLWTRGLLDAGAAGSTVTRRLSAVSSWYRHLGEHDLVASNPAAAVRRPRVHPDRTSTVGLDRDQTRALLAAADADTGLARLRNAAAIRLLLHQGMRVDELAGADIADLGHDRGHRY
jgi:site-specific recombinase XerD